MLMFHVCHVYDDPPGIMASGFICGNLLSNAAGLYGNKPEVQNRDNEVLIRPNILSTRGGRVHALGAEMSIERSLVSWATHTFCFKNLRRKRRQISASR